MYHVPDESRVFAARHQGGFSKQNSMHLNDSRKADDAVIAANGSATYTPVTLEDPIYFGDNLRTLCCSPEITLFTFGGTIRAA